MEMVDRTFADEALGAISKKAIERKTGARGLRSIMEIILLDTMFDLPSLEGVEEVIEGRNQSTLPTPIRMPASLDQRSYHGATAIVASKASPRFLLCNLHANSAVAAIFSVASDNHPGSSIDHGSICPLRLAFGSPHAALLARRRLDVHLAPRHNSDNSKGETMRHLLSVSAALLASTALVQVAAAQEGPADLVKAAVAAQGCADALKALKGISIKGEAKHWEPGQSYKADGEPRFLGDTTFTTTWDLNKGVAKMDLDRAMKYPAVETLKYSEVITPALGFVTNDKGSTAASGIRVAAQLRELERASPTLLFKVLEDQKNVATAGNQKLGNETIPAIS